MTEEQQETIDLIQHDRRVAREMIALLGLERSYDENIVIMLKTLANKAEKELSNTPFLRRRMGHLITFLRSELVEDHKLLTKRLKAYQLSITTNEG